MLQFLFPVKLSSEILLTTNLISTICLKECNFVVNNTLKSPGFPKNYPSNVDCTVTLPIPNEMTMKITFVYFDVEFSQPTCR